MVKTLVQDEVQCENVAFFTSRRPAVTRANSPRTVLGVRIGDDSLACNANYSMECTRVTAESYSVRKLERLRPHEGNWPHGKKEATRRRPLRRHVASLAN